VVKIADGLNIWWLNVI